MNKSSRTVMTFSGGIHPVANRKSLSNRKTVQTAPLLERYFVLLSENAGKPPKAIVKKGDKVARYQLIAQADGFVSANLHAPTSGEVASIVEVPGAMGVPSLAIEIVSDGLDAGEAPGGIPAKKGHETGIPDPDLVTADAFIHIGGYRSFAAGKNMGPSRLPCGIIKCNKIRVFLIDGSRDKVFRHETLSCREKRDDFFGFPVGISGN